MASLVRDTSASFVAQAVGTVLAVANQSCLAWFLGPEGYGSFAVCMVFTTLLTVVFMLGTDTAVMYFTASKRYSLSEGLSQAAAQVFICSAAAIVAGAVLLKTPLPYFAKARPIEFHVALVNVPLVFLANTYALLLTAVKDVVWYAVIYILRSAVVLALYIVLVAGLRLGVLGALFGQAISSLLIIFCCLALFVVRHGARAVRPSVGAFRETIGYGIRCYFGKVSNLVNIQVGTILLSMVGSREVIGIFATASNLVNRAQLVPFALNMGLISRTAEDKKEGRKELVAMCSRLSLLIVGVGLFLICLLATPLTVLLFSAEFLPAVPVIRVLSIGVTVRCATKLLGTYLTFTNRPGITSVAVSLGMAANLLVLWLLIPVLGAVGAAVAVTANHFVSSGVLQWSFSKHSGLTLRETWCFRKGDFAPARRLYQRVTN